MVGMEIISTYTLTTKLGVEKLALYLFLVCISSAFLFYFTLHFMTFADTLTYDPLLELGSVTRSALCDGL